MVTRLDLRQTRPSHAPAQRSRLRPPVVVTMSVAALLPCCKGEDASKQTASASPSVSASAAAAPSAASPSAPSARASALPPYGFELNPAVVNPKLGDKVILYGAQDACYTLGPEDGQTTGIQFSHDPVDCPEGIATTLASCRDGILNRQGDRCSCMSPEGNPPPPPRRVDCPD